MDEIEINLKKIEAILKWPQPTTVTEVLSFLEFCNYYCKFIYLYAQIARPLYKLISRDEAKKKSFNVKWSEECESAFQNLKETCTRTPILAYANYNKPF